MATPRKSDEKYPGYLEDQNRKPFVPSAREEELLSKTAHPEDLARAFAWIERLADRVETLEEALEDFKETFRVRFNELCNMLSVQLANSSFKLLEIRED